MAGYKYFTVLTDVGKQKLVEAIANETALDFTEMAVGDSNGTSYDPTPDMTALKHETYRATISSVSIDEVDRNIMIFQLVVPSSSGGYYIREAGLFSSDGSLIAIARTAEQYKPQLSEGAGASIDINMRIAISSEAQIYINVPESDSYATQNYVKEEFKKHTQKEDPHQQYMLKTYANEIFATKKHNHELSSLNGVLPVNKGGTGKTNATEAYTALGGKALGKMDSIALTDNKLTGVLPVNKGGTGHNVGSMPFVSSFINGKEKKESFTIPAMKVGEVFKCVDNAKKSITITFSTPGTYVYDYMTFYNDFSQLSNNARAIKVVTPNDNTITTVGSTVEFINITRIK